MSRPEFLLFGDSLTQQSFESGGWGAALADAYSRRVLTAVQYHSMSLVPRSFTTWAQTDLASCIRST